jgi:hypothetical protein
MDSYWPEETAGEPPPPGCVEGEWCWVHHAHEPGEGYRRCFECGHLYVTGRDLVKAYKAGCREALKTSPIPKIRDDKVIQWMTDTLGIPPPTRWQAVKSKVMGWWDWVTLTPERVYFCPACIHDF